MNYKQISLNLRFKELLMHLSNTHALYGSLSGEEIKAYYDLVAHIGAYEQTLRRDHSDR